MSTSILILLVVFQLKHLVADYYLQFEYMYMNKGKAIGWFNPLFQHSIVHGAGTIVIVGAFTGSVYITTVVTIFDIVTHFVTDRWKATRKTDPTQSWFWKSLGIDQMIHHLVGIAIIWYIV